MPYTLTHKQFYEGLKNGKLLGLKCKCCQKYTIPPRMTCMECGSDQLEIIEMKGEGEIRTLTTIRVAPDGFQAPYVVALSELAEGPWLMGNLTGVDPNRADIDLIGKRVKISCKEIPASPFTAGEGVSITFEILEPK